MWISCEKFSLPLNHPSTHFFCQNLDQRRDIPRTSRCSLNTKAYFKMHFTLLSTSIFCNSDYMALVVAGFEIPVSVRYFPLIKFQLQAKPSSTEVTKNFSLNGMRGYFFKKITSTFRNSLCTKRSLMTFKRIFLDNDCSQGIWIIPRFSFWLVQWQLTCRLTASDKIFSPKWYN